MSAISRREFIAGGTAAIGGLAAVGATVRSMLGARGALGAGAKLSAKDYVQNGLIAMWDGIENAGWGVHDANATVWKDLVGSHDWNLSTATVGENYIGVSKSSATLANGFSSGEIGTIEMSVYDIASVHAYFVQFVSGGPYIIFRLTNQYQFDGRNAFNLIPGTEGGTYTAIYSSDLVSAGYADGLPVQLVKWTDWPNGPINEMSMNHRSLPAVCKVRFMRLYSRALTAAEVAANYAVDKERFGLP